MNSPDPITDLRPPAVSVVIPARNAATTLDETLESVAAQAMGDWEAIVVDDGSADDTAAIAQRWSQRDARVRLVGGPQRGVSAARNAGVAQARAPIVAFLDADDLWLPTKLGRHLEHLRRQPGLGVSFARILFVDEAGRSTGVQSTPRVSGLAVHDYLYENPSCTASTLVARREALQDAGGFDETMRFAEDLELLVRMQVLTPWHVDGLGAVLTHYRANPRGASSSLEAMQAGWETLMDKVNGYAPELVGRHIRAARAVHLRYLARRALRLGLPASRGLAYFGRALASSPAALLRDPRRTVGTLLGLLASAVVGPVLSESAAPSRP